MFIFADYNRVIRCLMLCGRNGNGGYSQALFR